MENIEKLIISLEDENDTLKSLQNSIEDALLGIADNIRNEDLISYLENDLHEINYLIETNNEEIDDLYEEMNAETYEDWVKDRNREYERMV
jgi:hypothetical protein